MVRGQRRAQAGSSQAPGTSDPPQERFSDLLWYPHSTHRVSLASEEVC